MKLYVVVLETENKKIVKRVYRTYEEARQYLDELHSEVIDAKPRLYRLIGHENDELVMEELDENELSEHTQRKYTIVIGDIAELLNTVFTLIGDESSKLL